MNDQMIRVISSPSISTTGFLTLIFATGGRCYLPVGLARAAGPKSAAGATIGAHGNRRAPNLRQTRGCKPAAAAGRLQRLRRRPAAGRGGPARGRRVGRGADQ